MKTRGKISLKMLRKGAFSEKHFDKNNNFIARRVDPITLQTVHKSTTITQDR
jgi:serine/threonine-protein kinase PRP4